MCGGKFQTAAGIAQGTKIQEHHSAKYAESAMADGKEGTNMKKMREKSKRMRKVLGLLMAAVLCIGMFPISTKAQTNTITYLALGDSITTGYGLSDPDTEGFAAKFAAAIEEEGTTVTTVNAGVAGLTAETLVTALATGNYDAQIAAADVITITIGGNDLMAAFYECVAALYSSASGTSCTSVNVQTWLSDATTYYQEVATIVALLSSDTGAAALTAAISAAAQECVGNIESIIGLIRAANQDAVVLLANQYNPYASLGSVPAYAGISTLFATAVQGFNTLLSASGTVSANCEIVDLYSAGVSTNVDITTMNLDFHPNAAGHTTIASAMKTVYDAAAKTDSFTWEIPIAVTVEKGGSAAAPAQDFQVEILNSDGKTAVDLEAIGVTIASDIVSTDGSGTCTATLTFTGTGIALQELSSGFCVQLVSGTAAGWNYDDAVYTVYASFDDPTDASRMTSCEIYEFEDQTGETLLDAAAFTCTYTGWTLTFETNGGSTLSSVTAANGTAIDLSGYMPTRSGYTFTGWYTDSALTTAADSVTLSKDTTVYAGWKADSGTVTSQYTLTFETNGGSTINSVTAVEGTVIDLSDYTPTRSGYTFQGWYTDSALTTKVTSVTMNADQTIYAGWTKTSAADTATSTTTGTGSAKTGDGSAAGIWMMLFLIGGLGAAVLVAGSRKRVRNQSR